jgi:hypothetical protein
VSDLLLVPILLILPFRLKRFTWACFEIIFISTILLIPKKLNC